MDGGPYAKTDLAGGGFKERREDGRLLTGQGCYTADWNKPGQVHGAFLRADRAHALIESHDTSAARAAPRVLAVLTAADVGAAGYTRGQAFLPFKGRDGEGLKTSRSPALACKIARNNGPVAEEAYCLDLTR